MTSRQSKQSYIPEDPENFAVDDDIPCAYLQQNFTNPNSLNRLNSIQSMNFASLVKPSPFQQTEKSFSTPDVSPNVQKGIKSPLSSQQNTTASTGPYFFGSSSNLLPSLHHKDDVDPLAETTSGVLKENNSSNSVRTTGILKMGEKSRYSKGYPSFASVLLLPDMTSYSLDDISSEEEVIYPNKYVIEVSEDDEESHDESYLDYQSQGKIRFSQSQSQYTRSDFKIKTGSR